MILMNGLRCRAPHACNIRKIANNRLRLLTNSFYNLLHRVELVPITPNEYHHTVFGKLECRGAPYTGCGAGDDIGLALS